MLLLSRLPDGSREVSVVSSPRRGLFQLGRGRYCDWQAVDSDLNAFLAPIFPLVAGLLSLDSSDFSISESKSQRDRRIGHLCSNAIPCVDAFKCYNLVIDRSSKIESMSSMKDDRRRMESFTFMTPLFIYVCHSFICLDRFCNCSKIANVHQLFYKLHPSCVETVRARVFLRKHLDHKILTVRYNNIFQRRFKYTPLACRNNFSEKISLGKNYIFVRLQPAAWISAR